MRGARRRGRLRLRSKTLTSFEDRGCRLEEWPHLRDGSQRRLEQVTEPDLEPSRTRDRSDIRRWAAWREHARGARHAAKALREGDVLFRRADGAGKSKTP
jgi:hypothetical protein